MLRKFIIIVLPLQSNYSYATDPGHSKELWDHVTDQPGSAERVGPGADAETGAGTKAFWCV